MMAANFQFPWPPFVDLHAGLVRMNNELFVNWESRVLWGDNLWIFSFSFKEAYVEKQLLAYM